MEQAKSFVGEYGFKSLKLKGGVLEPDLEIETMLKLREVFPNHGLRIDPMGAWTVPTAKRVVEKLDGVRDHVSGRAFVGKRDHGILVRRELEDADLRDGLLGESVEFRDLLADVRAPDNVDDEIHLDVIRLTLSAADHDVGADDAGDLR